MRRDLYIGRQVVHLVGASVAGVRIRNTTAAAQRSQRVEIGKGNAIETVLPGSVCETCKLRNEVVA